MFYLQAIYASLQARIFIGANFFVQNELSIYDSLKNKTQQALSKFNKFKTNKQCK